jgi:hypothetical protein
MVIHPLVVNSFNKNLPRLKVMQLSQLTLEPHNSCYNCWVQVLYSHLPSLLFCSLLDIFDYGSVPGDVEDYISGLDDF